MFTFIKSCTVLLKKLESRKNEITKNKELFMLKSPKELAHLYKVNVQIPMLKYLQYLEGL